MNKHYAFSDLHGNYKLWTSIKNYCDETDIMIYLGDACDRGPDGIKIMQELIKDKRVIYLMGNHELLFLKGIKGYSTYNNDYELWMHNGGQPTLEQFLKLNNEEQRNLYSDIKNLGICCCYKDKFLSHSGCSFEDLLTKDLKDIDLLWNRSHFNDKVIGDKIIIHGHTPIQNFNKKEISIYRYCNNKKIDIDMGAYNSNTVALLDLDNLVPIYFKS